MRYENLMDILMDSTKIEISQLELPDGRIIVPKEFVCRGYDEDAVKQLLAEKISDYIEGKNVIVRTFPRIVKIENGEYTARARIGAYLT